MYANFRQTGPSRGAAVFQKWSPVRNPTGQGKSGSRRPRKKTVVSRSCHYESVREENAPWVVASYWPTRGPGVL